MNAPTRSRPTLSKLAILAALCVAAPAARAAKAPDGTVVNPTAGLSLKIRNATAPPGGALQAQVTLTHPKPILMGISTLSSSTGTLLGVSTVAPGTGVSDAFGTAVYQGGRVAVRAISPTAVLGAAAGVPFLTLTFGVPATTPRGTSGTFAMDGLASLWLDPAGQPYPQVIKNGNFTIAGTLGITNVFPGGVLPAGATVVVSGVGFLPGAIVEIDGTLVTATAFVSASELRATIGRPVDMFGRTVKVVNPDLTVADYYAYLRGLWFAPTANALLSSTDPMFAQQTFTSASWANTAVAGQFVGVAVQNPTPAAAVVTFDLLDATGKSVLTAPPPTLTLPPYNRVWRDTAELFGAAPPANGFLAVRASASIEMVGVLGDPVAGTVVPQVPALAFP